MKKLLLMAAVMLASVGAYAQHATGSFNIQPKVGINIANITDADDSDPRVGFVGGVEGEYQATDIFSVTAGVLYSMQGAKGGDDTDVTLKADYINIPILANVYVVKGLAVKVGIQPGFNVNSKLSGKSGKVSADFDIDAKTFDFSIPIGISYEYKNFVLDARYNWGLTKMFDKNKIAKNIGQYIDDDIDTSDFDIKSKNSVFQITLGYKFDL